MGVARVSSSLPFLVRGDIDGFFGLALDNLVQLLLIDSLCRGVLGFPPELAAFLELLGRTMLDVGETITKANRWSGHGEKAWIDDPYAWNQAVEAAQHILELSRLEGGEPHGLWAASDYPQNLMTQLGRQSADGILEVMRGQHERRHCAISCRRTWRPQGRRKTT